MREKAFVFVTALSCLGCIAGASAQTQTDAFQGEWEGLITVKGVLSGEAPHEMPIPAQEFALRFLITGEDVTIFVKDQEWKRLGERDQFRLRSTPIAGTVLGAIAVDDEVETWVFGIRVSDTDSIEILSSMVRSRTGVLPNVDLGDGFLITGQLLRGAHE